MFTNSHHCFTVDITSRSLSLIHTSFSPSSSIPFPQTLSLFLNTPSTYVTSVVAPVIVNFTASPSTGVSQGMPLNLTCEAVGGPTLNVTWTTPTGLRAGPVISVPKVTTVDAGDYRCEVLSEAGTANDIITIGGEGG